MSDILELEEGSGGGGGTGGTHSSHQTHHPPQPPNTGGGSSSRLQGGCGGQSNDVTGSGKIIKERLQTIMINNCNTSITIVTPGKSKTLTL